MSVLLLALALLTGQNPQYWIELGPVNKGQGMIVGSHGDGQNKPAVMGGRNCRIVDTAAGSSMIYVDVDDSFKPGPESYVTVDFFDQFGVISLNYDAGPADGAYRSSPNTYAQSNAGKWRTETFVLRKPSFKNRENGDTDFRILSSGQLAVAKIVLSNQPPKGYTPPMDPNAEFAERAPTKIHPKMEVIQQWQVHEPVPAGQLKDSAYEISKKAGITSLQSYVGWAQLEPEQGKITYDVYDPVVQQIRKHDLKWLPFIITGPYIATPKWFREQHGVDAVCLEHNQPIRIQSIWNPELRKNIPHFLKLFKDHYEPEVIEALNFGISGNWGESIYPVGGGFDMQGVHTHGGWWCGDKYAQADLQRWVSEKYLTIDALNKAWKSKYGSFDDVKPFLPANAPSRRAEVDIAKWYTQTMTDYAEIWVKTARNLYPTLPIYLCTGGDGQIPYGADFGEQAKMCAKYDAGIRITNMGDDMLDGFAITRMVSSACRLYGGYYTTEPGGDNTPKGMAGRIFDIVAGGGRGVYFKGIIESPDNATMNAIVFGDNAKYLIPNDPKLTVGAIMPNTSIALDGPSMGKFLERSMKLRDSLNFEFVDENMIGDGMLDHFKAVVLLSGDSLEASSIAKLKAWVESGGVLITSYETLPLKDVEGNAASWIQKPYDGKLPLKQSISGHPAGLTVDIGGADASVLSGGWHAPEGRNTSPSKESPDPSYRWTMGKSIISVPVPQGSPVMLKVLINVPEKMGNKAKISVNGVETIRLKPGETKWVEAQIPASAIRNTSALDIAFESPVWVPSASDPRELGLQVYGVQVFAKGTDPSKFTSIAKKDIPIDVDPAQAAKLTAKKLGKGYVMVWPDGWNTYMYALNTMLHTDKAPWKRLSEPLDAAYDNVLACRVGNSVYYLNNGDADITKRLPSGKSITIKPRSIVEVKD